MPRVFVSHATDDDAAVNALYDAFTTAGVEAWVDHREAIGYGDSWSRQIHEAANRCDVGLFVMSPASVKSAYCEAEWNRILALGKKLYIALIAPLPLADVPLRLGTIQYADLTRSREAALNDLIRVIQTGSVLDPQAATTGQARAVSGDFPRWQLDLPLIGRESDLKAVRSALEGGSRAAAILGLGGVGKTRLAAEIAAGSSFRDGVVWQTITPYATVAGLTLLIRNHLGLDVKAEADEVWLALAGRQVLIVLDNAEDCHEPTAYAARLNALDTSGGTRTLITSRTRWNELRHVKSHDLRAPDAGKAVEILKAMVEHEPPAFRIDGYEARLAEAARYHPRLMQSAVRWLDTYPPEEALRTLQTLKGQNAGEALDDMVQKTVRQLQAQPDGEAALVALRRLGVCRGGCTFEAAVAIALFPLPPVAVNEAAGEEETSGPGDGDNAVETQQTASPPDAHSLALLRQWGLIDIENGRYAVDPLVSAAIGVDENAYRPHFDYYLALARRHDNTQDYAGLDVESVNLETAFEWALPFAPEAAYSLANACFHFLGNRGRFDQRWNWFERVSAGLANDAGDRLRASVQKSLGSIYAEHPLGNRAANLRRAVAACQAALDYFTPENEPQEYANTQNNLGNAYSALAQIEDRAGNLRRAEECFLAALVHLTAESAPQSYAAIKDNLGNTYRQIAQIEDRVANLLRAIEAYQTALIYRTPETAPLDHATTQNNLGNVYTDLAEIKERTNNLQRLWRHMGARLGRKMSKERTDNLHRAIAAYEIALLYQTPQSAPLAYAQTQNNLGTAYSGLARIEHRADNLRRAIAAYQGALVYYTPQTVPLAYAMTQNNLGNIYYDLSRLEDRQGNLNRAVEAYRAALNYRTPQTAPLAYATTQRNLGIAYEALGDLPAAVAAWCEAEKHWRQMAALENADLMRRWIAKAGGECPQDRTKI